MKSPVGSKPAGACAVLSK